MLHPQEKVSKLEKELRENVDLVDKARGEVKSKEEEIKSLREEKEELQEKNNLLETRLDLNLLTVMLCTSILFSFMVSSLYFSTIVSSLPSLYYFPLLSYATVAATTNH